MYGEWRSVPNAPELRFPGLEWCDPPFNPDLHPSRDLLILESLACYVIPFSHLKQTLMASHFRYIKPVCVSAWHQMVPYVCEWYASAVIITCRAVKSNKPGMRTGPSFPLCQCSELLNLQMAKRNNKKKETLISAQQQVRLISFKYIPFLVECLMNVSGWGWRGPFAELTVLKQWKVTLFNSEY